MMRVTSLEAPPHPLVLSTAHADRERSFLMEEEEENESKHATQKAFVEEKGKGEDDPMLSQPPQPSLSQLQLFAMNSYWFSLFFFYSSVYLIIVPAKASDIAGDDEKGSALGLIKSSAAGANIIIVPLVGMLSDSTRGPFGKRKPYILLSGLLLSAGVLWLPYTTGMLDLMISYLMLSIGSNVSLPAFMALIPDNVPLHQRGAAGAWAVVLNAIGSLMGGLSMGFLASELGYEVCSYIISGIMLGGVALVIIFSPDVTTKGGSMEQADISEGSQQGGSLRGITKRVLLAIGKYCYGYLSPFSTADFAWAWLASAFYWIGFLTLTNFMQYYYSDAFSTPYEIFGFISIRDALSAMSIYMGIQVVGTLLSGSFAGKMVDQWVGYCWTVSIGCTIAAVGVGIIACSTIFELTLLGGFVFGCGSGLAYSALLALATRVLSTNDKNENTSNAKDLGMMSNNTNFAQILCMTANGFLLDYLKSNLSNGDQLGYVTLDVIAIICFLLGAITVWRVRAVR